MDGILTKLQDVENLHLPCVPGISGWSVTTSTEQKLGSHDVSLSEFLRRSLELRVSVMLSHRLKSIQIRKFRVYLGATKSEQRGHFL